jgi:L-fuculose-phosphate aldolase
VPNYVAGDLRDQLAHAGYSVVSAGLVVGSGGNLSARVPDADTCWVTGAGTWLDRLDRPDFAQVRLDDGSVVGDGTASPSTELPLHLATYHARPDVRAIIHLHPQTALLLDALGERIRLVSTDHAFYLRRIVTTPFRLPGGTDLAEVAAQAAADGANCVLLAHHGCSVLGETVELAHKRALYLEEAARLTYRALAAGVLATLPECPAEYSAALARGEAVSA